MTEQTNITLAVIDQETSLDLTDRLRASRAAIAQAKLTIARLKRYSSARTRGVLDQLCAAMDATRLTIEQLDLVRDYPTLPRHEEVLSPAATPAFPQFGALAKESYGVD